MLTSFDIIKSLLRTEKATLLAQENKYIFRVAKDANKIQIKKAVEEIYKVKVKDVNIIKIKGKTKRVRYQLGRLPDTKKAIVTLKEGKIELGV